MCRIGGYTLYNEGDLMNLEQSHQYRSLINTIDFFSQRLHVEQIIDYGYKIFEDLTRLEQGAIFTLNSDKTHYVARVVSGYSIELPDIEATEAHHEFASKNGFLLDVFEIQKRYFNKSFLQACNIDIILPLIIEDALYGFIIASEGHYPNGIKNREFLNRFCDLLNLALEKAISYERRLEMQKEIDKRIFNLNSYSQTMNALMIALDQDYIIKLCLDVVRELTASAVTSVLIERRPNQLQLAAYRDIVHNKECYANMTTKMGAKAPKVIYHVEQDREALEAIFESCESLDKLQASYVVFLEKERIIGCITLSEAVSGVKYDHQLLKQISNLASMMYIALDNANKFELLRDERNKISAQLNSLDHLNRSIQIINGADSLEELCSHVIDTLQYGFGVEEGFIWINASEYSCYKEVGVAHPQLTIEEIEWLDSQDGVRISYTSQPNMPLTTSTSNCFLCIPIVQRDYNKTCMGYLVVDQTASPLDEGLCMILETLANSFSPVVKQLIELDSYQRTHIKKPETLLRELFNQYHEAFIFYDVPYYLYVTEGNALELFSLYRHEQIEDGDRLSIASFELIFSHQLLHTPCYKQIEVNDFYELEEHLKGLSMN